MLSATSESESETNRTGIQLVSGVAHLIELDGNTTTPVEHAYSVGGSSLFQTKWLRLFANLAACYDPFYWEDVEWGGCAKAAGLQNVFVPDSLAAHAGKSTIRRFYRDDEVARVFERN